MLITHSSVISDKSVIVPCNPLPTLPVPSQSSCSIFRGLSYIALPSPPAAVCLSFCCCFLCALLRRQRCRSCAACCLCCCSRRALCRQCYVCSAHRHHWFSCRALCRQRYSDAAVLRIMCREDFLLGLLRVSSMGSHAVPVPTRQCPVYAT